MFEESSVPGSVSKWIDEWSEGSEEAAASLFHRFSERLLSMARRMAATSDAVTDEEDVVQEAFAACLRAVRRGEYPDVRHRGEFWFLLVRIAERKAIDLRRHSEAKKRFGEKAEGGRQGGTIYESTLVPGNETDQQGGFSNFPGNELSPEFATIFAEESKRLLGLLSPELREVLRLRMAGHTNADIAELLGKSKPTIERYARKIRDTWQATSMNHETHSN
jgi:RNA polymerase sigma factor (sigma-70 family)